MNPQPVPARVVAVQERRRSNAAGAHRNKRGGVRGNRRNALLDALVEYSYEPDELPLGVWG